MLMRIAAIAAVLCVAGSMLSAAQAQQPALRTSVASVSEGEYPNATALVSVEDASGDDLRSLTPANFTITVAGKPAKVATAQLAASQNLPLDVIIIMDTSGSMKGDALEGAKAAAKSFIADLGPDDHVAIMRFANSITVPQDFTNDHAALDSALDGLVAKGQTELFKATAAAAVKISQSTATRRAVILLTDGAQDAIVTDVDSTAALASARASGVAFFAVAEGNAVADPTYLTSLADGTHGSYLEAARPSDINGVYREIGQLLRNQYLVTFDASAAAGSSEAAISLQLQTVGKSATASATFHPTAAFVAPKISVTGLSTGESLTEPRQISVASTGKQPVTKVAYTVDGVNVFESVTAPFTFTYDPKSFGGGEHTLKIAVTTGAQPIDAAPITFTSQPPAGASAPTSTNAPSGGGGLPIIPIVAVLAVLALFGGGGAVLLRRRGQPVELALAPDQRVTPWTTPHRRVSAPPPDLEVDDSFVAEEIGEPMGVLISRSGSDLGSEYVVGGKPVSIGSGIKCAVRIADTSLSAEEARIWVRKGALMVHKMTRLTVIASDGVSGGWTMLDPGEIFEIGEHRFEFRLLPEESPVEDATTTPSASVLRDSPKPAPRPAPLKLGDAPIAEARPSLMNMMPHDMGFEEEAEQAS